MRIVIIIVRVSEIAKTTEKEIKSRFVHPFSGSVGVHMGKEVKNFMLNEMVE